MDGVELKRWNERLQEVQSLRGEVQHLRQELNVCRPALYRAYQKIDRLEQRDQKLAKENRLLKQKLAELTAELKCAKTKSRPALPSFVKPSVEKKPVSKPGRRKGHPAALRPMPKTIDVHQDVPLPVDSWGKPSCPHCHAQLLDVEDYRRYVEELIPFKLLTTCYHTHGGYCPGCRKHVESRAEDQPPAANIPHGED